MSENTKYTVERPVQIWNDKTGERYEIGPDRDGIDLVELRFYDANGKCIQSFVMPPEVWEHMKNEEVFV
jgi:hypothetical protein